MEPPKQLRETSPWASDTRLHQMVSWRANKKMAVELVNLSTKSETTGTCFTTRSSSSPRQAMTVLSNLTIWPPETTRHSKSRPAKLTSCAPPFTAPRWSQLPMETFAGNLSNQRKLTITGFQCAWWSRSCSARIPQIEPFQLKLLLRPWTSLRGTQAHSKISLRTIAWKTTLQIEAMRVILLSKTLTRRFWWAECPRLSRKIIVKGITKWRWKLKRTSNYKAIKWKTSLAEIIL